jgi:succinate dehydrogenase / fumarate reductase cytochrome b subunit
MGRYEFLLRRLHSLLGLVPVGAFLFIHLATNVSILDGPETYQARVTQIHSLGPMTLWTVEWLFIFLPILFHGLIGSLIVLRGKRNVHLYPYRENFRYTLERATGVITFAFILWHVFQTRGWFQSEWWVAHVTHPLGGGEFDAAQAAVTSAAAIQHSTAVLVFYVIGLLCSTYHLANGTWTAGITWGVWTTPHAQRWANYPCAALGLGLLVMGLSALAGMRVVPLP